MVQVKLFGFELSRMKDTEMELDETHEGCAWNVIDDIGNGSEADP